MSYNNKTELIKEQRFEKMIKKFMKQSKERQEDYSKYQNKLIRKRKVKKDV